MVSDCCRWSSTFICDSIVSQWRARVGRVRGQIESRVACQKTVRRESRQPCWMHRCNSFSIYRDMQLLLYEDRQTGRQAGRQTGSMLDCWHGSVMSVSVWFDPSRSVSSRSVLVIARSATSASPSGHRRLTRTSPILVTACRIAMPHTAWLIRDTRTAIGGGGYVL